MIKFQFSNQAGNEEREHNLHIVSEMPNFSFPNTIDFDNISSIRNNLISISWNESNDEVGETDDNWIEQYGLIDFEWKIERRNIRTLELVSIVQTEHPIRQAELVFPDVQVWFL